MAALNDIPGALDAWHIRLGPFVHAVWLATRKQIHRRALFAALKYQHTERVWSGKRVSDGVWERVPKNYYASWDCSLSRASGLLTNKQVRERLVVRVDHLADYCGSRAIAVRLPCDLCEERHPLPLRDLFDPYRYRMLEPTHFFCATCHFEAVQSARRITERLADRSGIADCRRIINAILQYKEQPNAEHA